MAAGLSGDVTVNYGGHVVEVLQSGTFEQWFRRLKRKDKITAARIDVRVLRLAGGNPGDVRPIGDGCLS